MTDVLATLDRMGLLPHLVERYSTADQVASYVVEGALDTEVRVKFTSAAKNLVGVGKTVDEAAQDLLAKLNAAVEPELAPVPQLKFSAKAKPSSKSKAAE